MQIILTANNTNKIRNYRMNSEQLKLQIKNQI